MNWPLPQLIPIIIGILLFITCNNAHSVDSSTNPVNQPLGSASRPSRDVIYDTNWKDLEQQRHLCPSTPSKDASLFHYIHSLPSQSTHAIQEFQNKVVMTLKLEKSPNYKADKQGITNIMSLQWFKNESYINIKLCCQYEEQHHELIDKSRALKHVDLALEKNEGTVNQSKESNVELEKDVERQKDELLAKDESMKKKFPWSNAAKEFEKAAKLLKEIKEPIKKIKR